MYLTQEYDANEISFACVFLFVNYVLCTVVVFALRLLKMYLWIVSVLTNFRAPRLDNFRVVSAPQLRVHISNAMLLHCYIVS